MVLRVGARVHAPELIDELVDGYAVEVQGVLEKEAETASKLIESVRRAASGGESATAPLVEKLERVARNWDRFAQPIQLSAKARGIDHDASNTLAYAIRSLAIDLFNEHDQNKPVEKAHEVARRSISPNFRSSLSGLGRTPAHCQIFTPSERRPRLKLKAREAEWAQAISFSLM